MDNEHFLFDTLTEAVAALTEADQKWDTTEEFRPVGSISLAHEVDGMLELGSGEKWVIIDASGEHMVTRDKLWICVA